MPDQALPGPPLRVLVADDNPVVRAAWRPCSTPTPTSGSRPGRRTVRRLSRPRPATAPT